MTSHFSQDYSSIDWDLPQPKLKRKTPITFPKLSSTYGSSVCIFTLDWAPWMVNTKHSVPFPVISEPRVIGRDKDGRRCIEVRAFNATNPEGVAISGNRDDVVEDSDDEEGSDGSKKQVPVGTIFGAVVGGVFCLVVLLGFLYQLRRCRNVKEKDEDTTATPSRSDNEPMVSSQSETRATRDLPPPTYEEATKI
ncbi:hypothetical protein EK21DRAFT_87664 [Setomelanomma holmii]|uniref:Uncharacterized protein n=1 Tax=Setomelanomma holmii TaxID=210430 RepID=A0A9P4HBY7_9PLEO|nr:hypothetical protein EK21DRAFT_87664 [Setomelanomma holmii]